MTSINKNLDILVTKLVSQHSGGKEFFDALDESVRSTPNYLEALLDLALESTPDWPDHYIASGSFGLHLHNYTMGNGYMQTAGLWLVNGGLRDGATVTGLDPYSIEIISSKWWKPRFIFLDDSFYSGRTRDAIQSKLHEIGAELIHTAVIYDGSPTQDPNVSSLYRYYKE